MTEARERVNNAASEICDALRFMGDVSYAILPRDVAHGLGDLNKSFLKFLRTAIDKEAEWIDERVAGGDRLRDEWKASCNRNDAEMGSEPLS